MILYTDRFVDAGAHASTRGPFIFVRPRYRDDVGLIEHEKVHRRQFFRVFVIHSFLYLLWPDYRYRAEVEAYKEQAKHYPDDRRPLFAQFICTKYGLTVSYSDALAALRS